MLPGARRLLTDFARRSSRPRRSGVAAESAPSWRPSTPRCASSSAGRSRCSRRSSTTAPTCWSRPSSRPRPRGTPAGPGSAGGDQLSYTAAIAAALAVPAADLNAKLNIQVHGGIGFTWEHDAHLYLRRAAAIAAVVDAEAAAIDVTDLVRRGVRRAAAIDLPPEAEAIRAAVRACRRSGSAALDGAARRQALIETGYVMPHWPRPWGRDAGAVEQLVIEQEFAAAGIERPGYGITGWVILTLIQHASPDQVARWVRPALRPGASSGASCSASQAPARTRPASGPGRPGSTAAGWSTARRSGPAARTMASFGLATVRTNPDAPKHQGITMMVIDMHAPGRRGPAAASMATGHSDFNEVFFNDVFVPDDDVVGPVDGGWTVARATLGNESVSIGGGEGSGLVPADAFIAPLDAHPERLSGGAGRVGRHVARTQAMGVLNLRSAHRAVAGRRPRARGQHHQAAALRDSATRPPRSWPSSPARMRAFLEGAGALAGVARAHAPGHVDRRRHLGDQAQPDRRADPRPPPRPADQVTRSDQRLAAARWFGS